MKILKWHLFPIKKLSKSDNFTKRVLKRQTGQTFIEFILLLASIVIVAFSFMRVANTGIADRWQSMAQVILEDDSQTLTPQ
tara:strand:- start:16797 stop:17039 length:243 start_codon:yes stop_codon:yes gene_type:complete